MSDFNQNDLMDAFRPSTNNIGRILIGLFFLISGVKSAMDLPGWMSSVASKNLPFPQIVGYIALGAKLLGGLSVTTNFMIGWGKLTLILFTAAATFLFHNPIQDPGQVNNFLKNTAVIGGLLLI